MRFNRMAPPRFARTPETPDAQRFWRGLRFAVVPAGGAGILGGIRELLHNGNPTAGYATKCGEANGPASNTAAGAGVHFGLAAYMPIAAPISVFSFLVRRDTSSSLQALVGNGALSANGWTFQLNYGAGQIGLTRWGLADNPSTTLGAVPNTGGQPSCVGMSYDGSNVRFFLNGRFQTVASGAIVAPGANNLAVGRNNGSVQPLINTSLHVLYLWARTLSDGEMMALYADPWAPIRPRSPIFAMGSALTGRLRVSQLVAEALVTPDPELRVSQIVCEVLIPQYGRVRVSQMAVEVLVGPDPSGTGKLRVSQLVAEALVTPNPKLRVTQLVGEVLIQAEAELRVSQLVAEVLVTPVPELRVSQLVCEVLVTPAVLSVPLTGQLFSRGSPPPFPY